jgi:hypothetical protein
MGYLSARLENEFGRLVMLTEIGGRIFLGQLQDREAFQIKTSGGDIAAPGSAPLEMLPHFLAVD